MSPRPPAINWAEVHGFLTRREREILNLWLNGFGIRRTRLLAGPSESSLLARCR